MKNDMQFPCPDAIESSPVDESTRNAVENAINRSKDDDASWGEVEEQDLQTDPVSAFSGSFPAERLSKPEEAKRWR